MWVEIELAGARIRLGPRWGPVMGPVHGLGGWCLEELGARAVEWEGVVEPSGQELVPDKESFRRLPAGLASLVAEALEAEPWEQELEEFKRWVQARVDYPKLNCTSCTELAETEGLEPRCAGCPLPPAPPWSEDVLKLWEQVRHLDSGAAEAVLTRALRALTSGQAWVVLGALRDLGERFGKGASSNPSRD